MFYGLDPVAQYCDKQTNNTWRTITITLTMSRSRGWHDSGGINYQAAGVALA
jgi:hypothetical protein